MTDWYTKLLNFRGQVTGTVYDTAYDFGGYTPRLVTAQQNVRNRVSYVTYRDTSGFSSCYNNASFYSYDIHGNVDTLLNDYGQSGYAANIMNKNGNRFKRFVYEYDLISGKVNKVTYQPGVTDQWIHRYYYDAENRLTEVETSVDGYGWDREAKYEYYLHGPLARTTLGNQQVQGIDYAYTLQGWLKGVNSTGGTATHDIGGDGKVGVANQYTARDAYGFNLNYFSGDYKPVNPGVTPFPAYRGSGTNLGLPDSSWRPLYNGNISSMHVYLDKLEAPNGQGGILYAYQYDQLNRLLKQDAFAGFDRSNNTYGERNTYGSSFKEDVSYDANGNIQTYNRNAGGYGSEMDQLTYHYYAGTNQLKRVNDAIYASKYGSGSNDLIVDIDDQTDSSNYVYDAIGNLVLDKSEGNTQVKWNVYGKITEVTRTPSAKAPYSKMSYSYDAAGNRISKITTRNDGRMDYTWYVRDAQGNLMTSYTTKDNDGTNKDSLQKLYLVYGEQYIYGSSRLGARNNVLGVGVDGEPYDYWLYGYGGSVFLRGARQYELSNHLGNVLSTISDKKFGVPLNDSTVSYYQPDIQSANDYYPFGMPSRVSLSNAGLEGQYRYGFNGKENDWQEKGWMNQQDYGMRIYDTRLGRFLSVDPLMKDYPSWSPYPFAMNRPIDGVDLDGMEWQPVNDKGENVSADSKDVAKYNWAGYNKDGSAKAGTVSGGFIHTPKGYVLYSSNNATKSGEALFMSQGTKEFLKKDAVIPSDKMPFDVSVIYQDRWQNEPDRRGPGGERKYVDVSIAGENENGAERIFSRGYSEIESPTVYNSPTGFFNQVRHSLGFADSQAGDAMIMIFPETILLPLPKGLSFGRLAYAAERGLVNLTEETFAQALFHGAEKIGGYSIYGTKGLVGKTFNRNIFLLEATGAKSLSGLRTLIGHMEAEAVRAGANKISIFGASVINKGFLNPKIAARFGYTFEQSGSGVFLQKILMP